MCARVKVHLLNLFRLELKRQYIEYEGAIVGDVIAQFERDHLDALPPYLKSPDRTRLNEGILVLVNGANVQNMDGMNTIIEDGDEIQLSVPIIGG